MTYVWSFLRLARFYRKIIKDFSKIAQPLTQLNKKNLTFEWNMKNEEDFVRLKECLTNVPILVIPDGED